MLQKTVDKDKEAQIIKPSKRVIPFVEDLDTPLLKFSPRDDFTLRDAVAHTHVFGGTGSGKTSGSGKSIAKAFLRGGFGGLVLCPNPDERELWEEYAAECGRSDHLIIVDDSGERCFNFMQYEMKRPAIGKSGIGDHIKRVENLVSSLLNIMEQGNDSSGGGEQTWIAAAEILLRNALFAVSQIQPNFNFVDIKLFLSNAPRSMPKASGAAFDNSGFGKQLKLAKRKYEEQGAGADFAATYHYWTNDFPMMPDKTRSSVLFTLDTILQNMPTGTLRRVYGTGSNFFPEDSFAGAIIILDMPAIDSQVNVMAQVLFKTVWQDAVLRRKASNDLRPVFLWADEAQLFLSKSDARFMALARKARAASVFMTQNLAGYYACMGGSNAKANADALLGNFQTHIFHSQADPDTVQFAMAKFGKRDRYKAGFQTGSNSGRSRGSTSGKMKGKSDNSSDGESTGVNFNVTTEDAVRPEQFNSLKNGGVKNRFIVQALVHRSGYVWKHTDENLLVVEFNQKI